VITVDAECSAVEPFDLAVAPGDDGKPFGVGLGSEAIWLGKHTELRSSSLRLRELSPACSRDHRVATHAPGDQRRACQDHRPSYAVSQVPSDKVLCLAKGRSAPLPAARESAVFCIAPLQSTAVRFRRRRSAGEAAGLSSVQFKRKRGCVARSPFWVQRTTGPGKRVLNECSLRGRRPRARRVPGRAAWVAEWLG
jgi:hypothetical protein